MFTNRYIFQVKKIQKKTPKKNEQLVMFININKKKKKVFFFLPAGISRPEDLKTA
jgi:hypothetical protein